MMARCEAVRPGLTSPEEDEGQTAANGLASQGQLQDSEIDSEGVVAAAQAIDVKIFATLQARAAIAGFELVRMADGSFVVARWTMTRALADGAAVEAFLQQVGAR